MYKITVDNPHSGKVAVFMDVFGAFGPSIEGFKHCRHILSIDKMYLYRKYGGVLLVSLEFMQMDDYFNLSSSISK